MYRQGFFRQFGSDYVSKPKREREEGVERRGGEGSGESGEERRGGREGLMSAKDAG